MPSEDLRSTPIEQLVADVQGFAAMASKSQVQSVAALIARCTIELSDSLGTVSGTVFQAKKTLATQLPELTAEIKDLRAELATSSRESEKHTAALVQWTRVLVVVTALYTLITGGLLIVSIMSR